MKVGRSASSIGVGPKSRLFRWPRIIGAGLIRLYQRGISPFFPARCRFYPSCSEYARTSLLRYGVVKGGYLTLRRLLRCHPWHPGGYDPVK